MFIITTLITLLMFGLLIFVHEFGHFYTAKKSGILVHEFAVGMGPKVWQKQTGETKYTLRLLPIGGYVKMEGEDEGSGNPRAFCNRPLYQRILVVVAGALMNLALGYLCFLFLTSMTPVLKGTTVEEVIPNSAAMEVGIMPGDKMLTINQDTIHIPKDATFALLLNRGTSVEITLERNGEKIVKTLVPKKDASGIPKIGVAWKDQSKTFMSVLGYSYYDTLSVVNSVFKTLAGLVTGQVPLNQLSSVIGIGQVVGGTVKEIPNDPLASFYSLIMLTAFISVNLGIFNLLPIPALDGGRVFFLLVEGIRRKPIPPEKEGVIHAVGFALLIALMVFAMYNDVFRLVVGK